MTTIHGREALERLDDDQALSALIDGELDDEAAEQLRERLMREPRLAERYHALRGVDVRLRQALHIVDEDPLPERVRSLLQAAPAASAPAQREEATRGAATVVPLRRFSAQRFFQAPVAVAASLALAIGFVLAQLVSAPAPGPDGPFAAPGPVAAGSPVLGALEGLPSNETMSLGAESAITPRLSFRHVDGGHCRLLDHARGADVTRAIACRDGEGWRIEMVARVPGVPAPGEGLYRPATDVSLPLDRALDAMMEGPPLGREEELERIQHRWSE